MIAVSRIVALSLKTKVVCMKTGSLFLGGCLLGLLMLQSGCQTCSCAGKQSKVRDQQAAAAAVGTPQVQPGWTVALPGDNL